MSGKSISYSYESSNSRYEGVIFDQTYIEDYLKTKVSAKYYDLECTEILVKDFSSIDKTGFSKNILEEVFSVEPDLKNWKIGECITECYLEDNHKIRFHYEPSRDAKNPEGNLHGADIVGFSELEDETIFVFGEVKTSTDTNSPPGVMSGRSGMICQLENIKDEDSIKQLLIRWLAFKVQGKDDTDPFRKDFIDALKTYFKSEKKKLKLVGVLLRDTSPNPKDLKSRYENFIQDMDPKMFLSLSAIYFSIQIDNLSNYLKKEDE